MGIATAKKAFNRKISLLTRKLDTELGKKLVRCNVWSIAFCMAQRPGLKKIGAEYFESFEMWSWRRMEKVK